jgi:hypothetical protein
MRALTRQAAGDGVSVAVRAAAFLFAFTGTLHILVLPGILLVQMSSGELPMLWGTRALGGPFETLGPWAVTGLGWALAAVSVAERMASAQVRKGLRSGGRLALILTILGAPLWIGFLLPYMLVVGPVRILLLARDWKKLN